MTKLSVSASSAQSSSSMIQSNISWLLKSFGWFRVSGKLRKSVESQQSQACALSPQMLADFGGQSFVQFNRIILRLKLKFLPQKNLQKLLSRAFKDEFLLVLTKKVIWDLLLSIWISSISDSSSPPLKLLNTWTIMARFYTQPTLFLATKNLKPQNISQFLIKNPSLFPPCLEHWNHQVHTRRNDHISYPGPRSMTWISLRAPDVIPVWNKNCVLSASGGTRHIAHIHHPSTCTSP